MLGEENMKCHIMYTTKTGFHQVEKEFHSFTIAEQWATKQEASYWEIGVVETTTKIPNNSLQPTPTSDVDLPDTPTRQGINMTQLLDTEGQTIPTEDGILLFNADLCDWGDGKGPDLTLNIPMYFKTEEGIYDGSGVISAPLKDVLEEYLQNFMKEDGGIGINDFVAWLHDYADRLKTARHAAHAG